MRHVCVIDYGNFLKHGHLTSESTVNAATLFLHVLRHVLLSTHWQSLIWLHGIWHFLQWGFQMVIKAFNFLVLLSDVRHEKYPREQSSEAEGFTGRQMGDIQHRMQNFVTGSRSGGWAIICHTHVWIPGRLQITGGKVGGGQNIWRAMAPPLAVDPVTFWRHEQSDDCVVFYLCIAWGTYFNPHTRGAEGCIYTGRHRWQRQARLGRV